MFCNKCGSEINKNMKFCGKCGQPTSAPNNGKPAQGMPAQGKPAQGMPAQGMPAQGMPTQGMPGNSNIQQPKKKSKKGLKIAAIIGSIVVVLAIIIAIVVGLLMNTKEAVVTRALNATVSSAYDELLEGATVLPVATHFSDMDSSQYYMEAELNSAGESIDVEIYSNLKAMEIESEVSYMGISAVAKLSEEYFTIEGSAVEEMLGNDVYGFEMAELTDSITALEDIFSDNSIDTDEVTAAMMDIITEEGYAYLKELEIEKDGKDKVKVDGKSVNASVYNIEFEADECAEVMINIMEAMLDDDIISDYIELCGDDVYYEFEYLIDDLEYSKEYMNGYTFECQLYIYKGTIVQLIIEESSSGSELEVALGSVKNVLEEVSISVDGYELAVFEQTYEDGVYEIKLTADEGSSYICFEYDSTDDNDNVELSISDYGYVESYTMTMTEPSKNELYMEVEIDGVSFVLESTKGSISGYTFEQEEDFEDLIDLLEDEMGMDIEEMVEMIINDLY